MSPGRISDRRQLLTQLDEERYRLDAAKVEEWGHKYQSAYGLLTSAEARAAFDLTQESTKTRSSYGRSTFGQGCLLARRFAEAGVLSPVRLDVVVDPRGPLTVLADWVVGNSKLDRRRYKDEGEARRLYLARRQNAINQLRPVNNDIT